ncbi:DUF2268 domain-containing putative Zn-dependent protease [Pontibacter silvestris]|uniref:DUF2268 domain-containing putative Zn-dependent protease n=1 Tax=Pontibacter silvestris TaxID=2305183 RepID=A0ABW4WYY2_9BACT|nr:DUF2268 domain-containing putative Zn-dependent protease [Pontibacter silvestris]MCC9135487.1 DUF2268 domain-containing protein [Pontibacter silvestris]
MRRNVISILLISILMLGCARPKAPIADVSLNSTNYTIETQEIESFWDAYDRLSNSTDSSLTFQELYLDRASPYFKEFLKLRGFKANEYVQLVRTMPEFWKSIRPLTENVQNRKSELQPAFDKLKELYPAFKQPDVCFAIGTLRTGGTTSESLILIGTEIVAADNAVNISEFDNDDFMKLVLKNQTGDIIGVVAHEAVHTQQPGGDNGDESLLKPTIVEGAADFIASLMLGRITQSKVIYDYGIEHEKELWSEFYSDVKNGKSIDNTDWMYDYRTNRTNRPADLAYFIGFKICEEYYNNARDKTQAIKDIIMMSDAESFLLKSGYTEKYSS